MTVTISVLMVQLFGSNTTSPVQADSPKAGDTRTDAKGIKQVYVPAGCFTMGADPAKDKLAQAAEQPAHPACISKAYWLDQYEVTNEAYQQFIDAGGYKDKQWWSAAGWAWLQGSARRPKAYRGYIDVQQPRVGITWYEAEAYATWRGGRLPTEAEWEYAARGEKGVLYPWGDTFDAKKLNWCNKGCRYDWRNGDFNDGFGKSAPVGSYPDNVTWVKAYDMAGNAWEWCADWFSAAAYRSSTTKDDPLGPSSGAGKVLRGAGWSSLPPDTRLTYRFYRPAASYGYDITVRVVSPIER
ncbi:MAG: SUMF1/EgtB/PvdO family nonheme iron enzyme [Chloroflexota bacterium]